jgi:hypothetical protein
MPIVKAAEYVEIKAFAGLIRQVGKQVLRPAIAFQGSGKKVRTWQAISCKRFERTIEDRGAGRRPPLIGVARPLRSNVDIFMIAGGESEGDEY